MIGLLKKLLGIGPRVNMAELIANGATIVDVRTRGEYNSGHVRGSVNVPLDQLSALDKKFKDRDHVIITCCASGMRSASAKNMLRSIGFTNVHNGGSWRSLLRYQK